MRPLVTQEAGNTPQHAQRFDCTWAISEPISDVEPVPTADGALVPGPWQQLQAWKPRRVGPDAVPESRRTTVHDPDDGVGDTRGVDSGAIATDDDIERALPRRFIRLDSLLGPVRLFPLFGEDRAGLDDRNRNPERLDLVAERLRVSFERPFRGAVDGSEGQRVESRERCDIDDLAGTSCPEQWQSRSRHAVRAEEVRLEHVLRLVDARFLRSAEETKAGIVDENVEVAGEGVNVLKRGAHRVVRAHVKLEKRELRRNACLCRATAGPEHRETILLERESNRPSEPRSSTGDEGHSLLLGFVRIPRRPATFNIGAWIGVYAHSCFSYSQTVMAARRCDAAQRQ